MKKKLLIITYYWPPSGGVAVLRWLKYSVLLSDKYDITVYCPDNPDYPTLDPNLENEIPKSIKVIRGRIIEPYNWFRRLTFKKKNYHPKQEFASKKNKTLIEKIAVFIRGNFFIPDARMFWIKPSISRLKTELANNTYDLIITNGTPHSVHLIGLGLKKIFPKIPWLADFRDPWTKVDYFDNLYLTRWGRKRHQRYEYNVLKGADIVTTVSKSWADDFKTLGAKSVDYIYNGYDEKDFEGLSAQPNEKKFVISHIGSLNSSRNHDSFWAAMSRFINSSIIGSDQQIEIRLVGSLAPEVDTSILRYNLDQYIIKTGVVSHEQSLIEMLQADVLVLLTGDQNDHGRIPAKVFEYFAAQKPILPYAPEKSEVYQLIMRHNHGIEPTEKTKLLFELHSMNYSANYNNTSSTFTKQKLVNKFITNFTNLIKDHE